VCQLKNKIKEAYNLILSYVVPPKKLDFDLLKFTNLNWNDQNNQKKWFYSSTEFIKYVSEELNPGIFAELKDLSSQNQKDFHKVCISFVSKILSLFPKYFTFTADALDLTSFLELKGSFADIKENFLEFGKRYGVINQENIAQFQSEIVKLFSDPLLQSYKELAENQTLKLWDHINEKEFSLLHKVARIAHSLPTKSATLNNLFQS